VREAPWCWRIHRRPRLTEYRAHPYPSSPVTGQNTVRDMVLEMGEMVDVTIARAMGALIDRNVDLAAMVIEGDDLVNACQADVHRQCLSMIALRAPVARDLREVLSFMHMSDELERIADHCAGSARIARNLAELPPMHGGIDLTVLSNLVT